MRVLKFSELSDVSEAQSFRHSYIHNTIIRCSFLMLDLNYHGAFHLRYLCNVYSEI